MKKYSGICSEFVKADKQNKNNINKIRNKEKQAISNKAKNATDVTIENGELTNKKEEPSQLITGSNLRLTGIKVFHQ